MFCKVCGANINDGAKFCGSCGATQNVQSNNAGIGEQPVAPSTPVNTAPVYTAPVNTAPVNTAPVNTAPVNTAPVNAAPVQTQPVNTAPVQTQPVNTAPVYNPPEETAPLEPQNGSVAQSGGQAPIYATPVNVSYNNDNNQPVAGVSQVQGQSAQAQPLAPKGKNGKMIGIIIGCSALAVLVIIGIVLAVVFSSNSNKEPEKPPVEQSALTESAAEDFFNDMMAEHNDDSYSFVYAKSIDDIKANKLGYLCDCVGVFYSWSAYAGELTDSTLNVNDIMTEDEYNNLIVSGAYTWSVFKAEDVQSTLNGIFGKGKYSAEDLLSSTAVITKSGYLFYPEEPVTSTNTFYFGKVNSCTQNGEECVVEAYVLRCDNSLGQIYDESVGTSVGLGNVTPGTDVTFDSVVSGIGINTTTMSKIKFTIGHSNGKPYLKSVEKPDAKQVGSVEKGSTTTYQPQVDGTVTYCSSYYMYVAADGGLNVRSLPTKSSSKITNIPDGGSVVVLGYSSIYYGWSYIEYGGYYGWVASDYLVSSPSTNYSNVCGWYTVVASPTLNIRSGPGKSYGVIGSIPDGSAVYVQKCNQSGSWAYVTYGGVTGWISTSYLW